MCYIGGYIILIAGRYFKYCPSLLLREIIQNKRLFCPYMGKYGSEKACNLAYFTQYYIVVF